MPSSPDAADPAGDTEAITLVVHGMSCPLCASNVDQQLLAIPGVTDVRVDIGSGRVEVMYEDGRRPSTASLSRAVERSGFTLASIENR